MVIDFYCYFVDDVDGVTRSINQENIGNSFGLAKEIDYNLHKIAWIA